MSGHGDYLAGIQRWSLGPKGYQFFGTEGTMQKTFLDVDVPGRYLPLGNWVFVKPRVEDNAVVFTSKPIISNLRESSSDPKKWEYTANPYLSKYNPKLYRKLPISPAYQPDGAGVKKWSNPKFQATNWLGTTWAEPHAGHALNWQSGSTSYFYNSGLTDLKFDLAPIFYSRNKGKEQAPDSDWWRGGCVKKVVSGDFGVRNFIIMVTVTHDFYCYPVNTYDTTLPPPNVNAGYFQSVEAPLPAWVTVSDVGRNSSLSTDEQIYQTMPCWVFSPNGDRAAAVMYKKEDAWADSYITSKRYDYSPTNSFELKENRPGIVEVEFVIEIDGPNPEDFTFSVQLSKSLYSEDDGRGYVAVAYSTVELENVRYGDLLILEHKYYISEMFQLATLYESGSGINDTDAHVLVQPAIAVTAHVMNSNEEIMSWLSSYVATFGPLQSRALITEPMLLSPTFSSISDKPVDDNGQRQFCFHTAINAMDLSTLTFCFGASATLVGFTNTTGNSYIDLGGDILYLDYDSPFCASAAYVCTYSLGELDEERYVGHTDLKAKTKEYFNLTNSVPNLSLFKQISLNAKISSTAFTPTYEQLEDLYNLSYYKTVDSYYEGFNSQLLFSEISLNTGFETITKSVIFSSSIFYCYDNLTELQFGPNNLGVTYINKDAYMGWIPRVFTFFDGQAYERPGLRWTVKEQKSGTFEWKWKGVNSSPSIEYILEDGNTSFSDYPLGLILHNRFTWIALNALNNPYASLSAEPNGSYAVFFGPFAAPTSTVLTHVDLDEPIPNYTTFTMEQNVLDVIKMRLVKDRTYVEGKTTHIAAVNEAYSLSLSASNYIFDFYFETNSLSINHRSYIPHLVTAWKLGSKYDYNYNYIQPGTGWSKEGQIGGAIILGPIALGWEKTFLGNGVDYQQLQTFPTFDFLDLQTMETPYFVVLPTPRMCGVFTNLPLEPTD